MNNDFLSLVWTASHSESSSSNFPCFHHSIFLFSYLTCSLFFIRVMACGVELVVAEVPEACGLLLTRIFYRREHVPFRVGELVCQTFPTSMFFRSCPQKLRTFTGHLWKVIKAQKFAPPSSEAHVSAKVGLALAQIKHWLADLPIPFPHAIHTASNYISFKYNIPIALYSLRFMIHAKTKPNNSHRGVGFSWAFFFRFVAYQPHQLCQISCANN